MSQNQCSLVKLKNLSFNKNNLFVTPDFQVPLITVIKGYKVIKSDHKAQAIFIKLKHLFIV